MKKRTRYGFCCAWLAIAQVQHIHAQPTRRFADDSLWRKLWVAGAEKHSEMFVEPRQTVISGDAVYVLDMGTREVRGFDRRSGKQTMVLAARGSGPGEFKRPKYVVPTPDGFAVLDEANFRLTGFSRLGQLRWDIVVPETPLVTGICVASFNRMITIYGRPDSAVVVFDTSGRALETRRINWPLARPTKMMFAHQSYLSAVAPSGGCALARLFGGQWARLSATPRGRDSIFSLIEAGAEPLMKSGPEKVTELDHGVRVEGLETSDTKTIVRAVVVRGDTAILQSSQSKQFPHRLLDYYSLSTGRYLYSRVLPMELMSLAVDRDGVFYGTVISENTQALVAFRPERLTKSVQKEIDRARERARELERARATKLQPDTLVRRPKPPNERR